MSNINYSVEDCTLLHFGTTRPGPVSYIDPLRNELESPFPVKRMYYLFDIPMDKIRGGHAHKELRQIVVAIKGCFSLKLADGRKERIVILDNPRTGLCLVPGIWRDLFDFTPGATCMVLASEVYNEKDYIRDYGEFLIHKGIRRTSAHGGRPHPADLRDQPVNNMQIIP